LGYQAAHRQLEERFLQYRYIPLTTREPENLNPDVPGYGGKTYVQDYFDSGRFEEETGVPLDPRHTHVFLCGNPAMIGAPLPHARLDDGTWEFPQPTGMIEVLHRRGLTLETATDAGRIHFEKYW